MGKKLETVLYYKNKFLEENWCLLTEKIICFLADEKNQNTKNQSIFEEKLIYSKVDDPAILSYQKTDKDYILLCKPHKKWTMNY